MTTGFMLSFRKYLPAVNASIAPMVVAAEQQMVPSTGPNKRPAAIAKVTPGSASATHPTIVTAM